MAVLPSAESTTDIPWPGGNGGSPAPLPTSFLPCCIQTSPLRVNTHVAPHRPIVARSANDGGVAVGGEGDGCTLGPQSPSVFAGGADQLAALLPPATAAAREHPRRANRADEGRPIAISVVRTRPAHDGGIAVRGKGDRHALVSASHRAAGSDQLRSLLEGLRRCNLPNRPKIPLVNPAETQCYGFPFVTIPETNQHEKHKAGNRKGDQRKQNTANHSCHCGPIGIDG